MAKTTKRSKRTKPTHRLTLTPDEQVERDMRRAVKRQRNIRRLQHQIARELEKSRVQLTDFVQWLIASGHADPGGEVRGIASRNSQGE